MAAVAVCLAITTLHPAWTLIAAAAGLALAWLPGLAVLGTRGPWAVRRFEWAPDGAWHLTRPDGRVEPASLAAATVTLGPWILLAWTVESPHWRPLSGRYALIGLGAVGPAAFRALKGRLAVVSGRPAGHIGTVAP